VPTYDYRCKACGQELEVFQSFSDDPLTTCTACGGELRKLFGAPGIAFKGSGFYKTDSRRSSGGATAPVTGEKSSVEKSGAEKGSSGTAASTDASSSSNGSGGSTKKQPATSTSSSTDSTA
jgi:putative FmdB family regulatory protein